MGPPVAQGAHCTSSPPPRRMWLRHPRLAPFWFAARAPGGRGRRWSTYLNRNRARRGRQVAGQCDLDDRWPGAKGREMERGKLAVEADVLESDSPRIDSNGPSSALALDSATSVGILSARCRGTT
ncbi:hypothetical protein GQ53DRAFT_344776 [Thozetella sp. PMI_491]|nr:hypothetical protein GQ53DRAFT_344776 [Thozetella sp. PMI_491]